MKKIALSVLLIAGLCASPGFCAGIAPFFEDEMGMTYSEITARYGVYEFEPIEWGFATSLQLLLTARMVAHEPGGLPMELEYTRNILGKNWRVVYALANFRVNAILLGLDDIPDGDRREFIYETDGIITGQLNNPQQACLNTLEEPDEDRWFRFIKFMTDDRYHIWLNARGMTTKERFSFFIRIGDSLNSAEAKDLATYRQRIEEWNNTAGLPENYN